MTCSLRGYIGYILYWGYIYMCIYIYIHILFFGGGGTPIMENQMENEMETGIIMGYIRVILGLYGDNGKEKWKLL